MTMRMPHPLPQVPLQLTCSESLLDTSLLALVGICIKYTTKLEVQQVLKQRCVLSYALVNNVKDLKEWFLKNRDTLRY